MFALRFENTCCGRGCSALTWPPGDGPYCGLFKSDLGVNHDPRLPIRHPKCKGRFGKAGEVDIAGLILGRDRT